MRKVIFAGFLVLFVNGIATLLSFTEGNLSQAAYRDAACTAGAIIQDLDDSREKIILADAASECRSDCKETWRLCKKQCSFLIGIDNVILCESNCDPIYKQCVQGCF